MLPHNFNKEEYKKIDVVDKKIEYINTCLDKEIIITTDSRDDIYILNKNNYSSELFLALVNKRYTINGKNILYQVINTKQTDFIIKCLKIYEDNNWFTLDSEKSIIHNITNLNTGWGTIDDTLLTYVLDMYDRLKLPINIKYKYNYGGNTIYKEEDTLDYCARLNRLSIILRILKEYKKRNIELDKNIFVKYSLRVHNEISLLPEFVNFCLDNEIYLYNKEKIKNNWYLENDNQFNNFVIYPLYYYIKYMDKDLLLKVFNNYIENGECINDENNNVLNIMCNSFDVDMIQYMLDYNKKHDIKHDETSMLEFALNNNENMTVFKYLISLGFRPENKMYREYVPCDDCHNGESHYCNYRNVTFEYLLMKRFGIRIKDLDDKEKMDKLVDDGVIYHNYTDFEGKANDNEIYTEPKVPAKFILKSQIK